MDVKHLYDEESREGYRQLIMNKKVVALLESLGYDISGYWIYRRKKRWNFFSVDVNVGKFCIENRSVIFSVDDSARVEEIETLAKAVLVKLNYPVFVKIRCLLPSEDERSSLAPTGTVSPESVWYCIYCGFLNYGEKLTCFNCGAGLRRN